MIAEADRCLARLEFSRAWRHPLLWAAAALTTVLVGPFGFADPGRWAGERYGSVVDLSTAPLFIAAFLIGAMSTNRDSLQPLAPVAAVDTNRRTAARLAGIAPVTIVAVVTMIAIAVVSARRGGFWLGEDPWSTHSFQPPVVALLQGPLLVAVFGTAGLLVGRTVTSKPVIVGIAAGLLFGFVLLWWAWQWLPMAPLKVMPLEVDVLDFDRTTVPSGWYMVRPNEYEDAWRRQLVHEPTIIGHDIYLAGLATAFGGLAVRTGGGRRVAVLGAAIACAGIIIQLMVDPS